MNLPMPVDVISFFIGFVTASLFWWLVGHARTLLAEVSQNTKKQREEAQTRRTSTVEENHRRATLRRAQGMHLAAPLFALDEILQEPRVMAPLPRVEPGGPSAAEDATTQTLPYLPGWPELAAVYNAPSFTVPQALSGGSNIVLIGQPGAGKTVAVAHLASLAVNRREELGPLKDRVPFLLHVADLKLPVNDPKNVLDPIIEFVSEEASMFDLGRMPAFIENSFHSGRALLLVDGYDELTAEGQQLISEYLKTLLAAHPKTRIVITGAPEYLDGLIELGFVPLSMAGWNKTHIRQFIQKWGDSWDQFIALEAREQSGPQQVDSILLNAWLDADNQKLSPLELTLKVWAGYAGDSLGSHVLEGIASHVRRLAPNNTPLAALETLAMQVVVNGQPVFDPHSARDWVKSFEPSEETETSQEIQPTSSDDSEENTPKKKKKEKKSKTITPTPSAGLLGKMSSTGLVISHPNSRMRFVHPVILGFLAGRALSNYNATDMLLNQPDWSGKYLAMHYLAANGDVSKFVQNMLEWSRLPIHRPMIAAARWLRDAPRDAPWRGKLMTALAQLLQTEGIPSALRGQALAAFVASDDPAVTTLFRQMMGTLSFEVVRLAALGSGALRDGKSMPLLEGILESPSLSARRAACLALVAIGTNDALEIVAHILLNADEDLRRAAAEALANDPKEGHAMLKDGATLSDILVRRAVVYGLARVSEPWAHELLQKMQVEDEQWVVRNSANEVLDARNQTDNPRVPRPLKNPSEISWLIEFAGTQGVGIPPGSPATDILVSALKNGKEEERLAALPYLKKNLTDGMIKEIYHAMYGDDIELREAAYMTLWEIGTSGYKLPDPTRFGLS
ncbi:MAG TPA: HEAT repeat domain-containing protein [Anaerolineales bacterium]|nr:HEAT repeat domain-containing protein [Anaerolineales bacterium]